VGDVSSIPQEHLGNRASVLILAECLERDFFPEDKGRGSFLRSFAVALPFLRTIDAVESDTFRVSIVEDFDRVAVKYGDDRSGEVLCASKPSCC
jgi:hypothetical protein